MKKLLLFLFPLFLQAQTTTLRPDCILQVNVPVGSALPFNIGPFDNRTIACTSWTFAYNSYTYSALSIIVQTAPNVSAGVPGSWSTFAPTNSTSNPQTDTTKGIATFGGPTIYFPWLRVQLTSATGAGTISGTLYGYRNPAASVTPVTPSTCPAAPDGSVQYDSSGACAGDSTITIQGTPKALVVTNSGSCFGSLAVANNDATFPYFDSSTGLCVAESTSNSTWDYNAFLSYVLMDSTNHNAQAQVSEVEIQNGLALSGNRRIQVHEVWVQDQGATGSLASAKWLRLGGELDVAVSGNVDIFTIDPGIASIIGGDFNGLNFSVNPSGVISGEESALKITLGTAGAAVARAINIAALSGTATDAAAIELGDWSMGGSGFALRVAGGTNRFTTGGPTLIGLAIVADAAQTANLFQSVASDGTTIGSGLSNAGYLFTRLNAAPASGDIFASEEMVWFDPTNGAPAFNAKAKQADGTVVNLSIPYGATFPASGTIATRVQWSSAIDFASIADGTCLQSTFAAAGALVSDNIATLRPAGLADSVEMTAWVSSAGNLRIQLCNFSGGAIDPASLTYGGEAIR